MNPSAGGVNAMRISHRSNCRGGSRIPRRRGRQPSRGGRQHTVLPNFPKEKMHEIEKILDCWEGGGGGAGSAPLKSASELF